ncbi:hypothetical protein [Leucobacter sp. M11]|uniref:hypothetical protein n=1 Tax=Leucobacter sp. M11 TaxID=2993565 RepID=UPI002D80BB1E|nr:hypothetical protein [Leucobacter sp. M11]MEB4616359.1 hypothetical protein [Leucobacter sp. M11]
MTPHPPDIKTILADPPYELEESERRMFPTPVPIILATLLWAVMLFFVALAVNAEPGGVLWVVVTAATEFLTARGIPILGIVFALIAAAVTAVTIVGYRNEAPLSPPKLSAILDVLRWLLLLAMTGAAFVALGTILTPVLLAELERSLEAWGGNTALSESTVSLLSSVLDTFFLGALSIGFLVLGHVLARAVEMWPRADETVLEGERERLWQRIQNENEAVNKVSPWKGTRNELTHRQAVVHALALTALALVLSLSLTSWVSAGLPEAQRTPLLSASLTVCSGVCALVWLTWTGVWSHLSAMPTASKPGTDSVPGLGLWRAKFGLLIACLVLGFLLYGVVWWLVASHLLSAGGTVWVLFGLVVGIPLVVLGVPWPKGSLKQAGWHLARRRLQQLLDADIRRLGQYDRGTAQALAVSDDPPETAVSTMPSHVVLAVPPAERNGADTLALVTVLMAGIAACVLCRRRP